MHNTYNILHIQKHSKLSKLAVFHWRLAAALNWLNGMERFTTELIRYKSLSPTALELFVGCDGKCKNTYCSKYDYVETTNKNSLFTTDRKSTLFHDDSRKKNCAIR